MISIPCQVPEHKKEITEYYCFSQFCQDNRLICYQCSKQLQHQDHQVLRISRLSEQGRCQEMIDNLYVLKVQLDDSIDELIKILQEKYQQQLNNLSQFTYDQFQSYLQGILSFDQNKVMIDDDVIAHLTLTKYNIDEAVNMLKVKENSHQQAPPEMQQQAIELQNQVTQLQFYHDFNVLQNDSWNTKDIPKALDLKQIFSLVMKGNLLLSQTKYSEAQTIFERVLEINPTNKDAINGLGDCLRGRSRHVDALKCYEKTLERNPNNKQALIGQAHCLGKEKKFQEAKQIFERILNLNKSDIEALWGLGIFMNKISIADLLRIQGKDDEAIKAFNSVLQQNQNHLDSISGLGDCYRLLGQYDDAMIQLNNALQINPKHALSLSRIGDCLRQQKKFKEAINYYSEALEIDPQDDWSQSKMNECQIRSRKRE